MHDSQVTLDGGLRILKTMLLQIGFVNLLTVAMTQAYETMCLKPEPEVALLNCSSDHVINVHEAIYGRNKWEECVYTAGDCTENYDINELCCGKQNCSFQIRKAYSLTCGFYTFFRVIYTCVEAHHLTCREPPTWKPKITSPSPTTGSPHSSPTSTATITTNLQNTETTKVSKKRAVPSPSSEMAIIIGSAVTVAVLLVAILTVLFLLRRFSWEKEKFYILGIFVSLCKRQPPDGSEEPDEQSQTEEINTPNLLERGEKPQVDSNQNVQAPKPALTLEKNVYFIQDTPTVAQTTEKKYPHPALDSKQFSEPVVTDV